MSQTIMECPLVSLGPDFSLKLQTCSQFIIKLITPLQNPGFVQRSARIHRTRVWHRLISKHDIKIWMETRKCKGCDKLHGSIQCKVFNIQLMTVTGTNVMLEHFRWALPATTITQFLSPRVRIQGGITWYEDGPLMISDRFINNHLIVSVTEKKLNQD